jgi:hypothetical protein
MTKAEFLETYDRFPKHIYAIKNSVRQATAMLTYYQASGSPTTVGVVAENVLWARRVVAERAGGE